MRDSKERPPAANQGPSGVSDDTYIVRRAIVSVDEDTITVRGAEVRNTLRRQRMRPIFVGTTGGWMLDRRRLGDAMAALERAGYSVRVEGDLRTHATPPVTPEEILSPEPEAGLW